MRNSLTKRNRYNYKGEASQRLLNNTKSIAFLGKQEKTINNFAFPPMILNNALLFAPSDFESKV